MRLCWIIYVKAPWKLKSTVMQPGEVVLPTILTIEQPRVAVSLSQGYIASSWPVIDTYHNHTARKNKTKQRRIRSVSKRL